MNDVSPPEIVSVGLKGEAEDQRIPLDWLVCFTTLFDSVCAIWMPTKVNRLLARELCFLPGLCLAVNSSCFRPIPFPAKWNRMKPKMSLYAWKKWENAGSSIESVPFRASHFCYKHHTTVSSSNTWPSLSDTKAGWIAEWPDAKKLLVKWDASLCVAWVWCPEFPNSIN